MHQAALAAVPALPSHLPPEPVTSGRSLYTRRRRRVPTSSIAVRNGESSIKALSELDRRVDALLSITAAESPPASSPLTSLSPEEFSETELLAFYENVLAQPTAQPSPQEIAQTLQAYQEERDRVLVNSIANRIIGTTDIDSVTSDSSFSSLSNILQQRQPKNETDDSLLSQPSTPVSSLPIHQQILLRVEQLQRLIPKTAPIPKSLKPVVATAVLQESRTSALIPLLSDEEWKSLVRICLQSNDTHSAETVLNLMKRSGLVPPEEAINDVLDVYATRGDIMETERCMRTFLTERPTDRQRHLHIKSHQNSVPTGTIPTSALNLLHHYESQSLPAPMTAYTRVITALFSVPSSIAHAQASDLFTHMRYVAHPEPDTLLYTLIIRACASSPYNKSEPERALDLFTEMTVDRGLLPTAGTYSAVILACARSGSKEYVNEAFRLAKEMLDAHRDAWGRSAFHPDGRTCAALLEGAKRIGDLSRVRWILAEMAKGVQGKNDDVGASMDAEINEEIMMHVFHAYAAYRPPFKRSIAPLVEKTDASSQLSSSSGSPSSDIHPGSSSAKEPFLVEASPGFGFKHLPPQSRPEVIREAEILFARIVEDNSPASSGEVLHSPFSKVRLTPRLLNSYLSVHYAHGSLEASQLLFHTLFSKLEVGRNAHSYVDVLERCSIARRGRDREVALSFADSIWEEWSEVENVRRLPNGRPVSARMIERANAAMIRVLTLSNELDRAMAHLRAFVSQYPPNVIRKPPTLPAMRSTRTALTGLRPLVRVNSVLEVPDDTIPPLISFSDLEILHHRLLATGKQEALGYIKWVCKAYEGALRARRDATMRAVPSDQGDQTLPVDL